MQLANMIMKGISKYLIFVVLILAVIGAAYYAWTTRFEISTDDAAVESHVAALSTKISGYVTDVAFNDNQSVKKDDVLLHIDPRDYQIALDQKNAALASSEAKLAAAEEGYTSVGAMLNSSLETARADVTSAAAKAQKAQQDLVRLQSMNPDAYARRDMDAAIQADRSARSDLTSAQAKLRSAESAPHSIAANKKVIDSLIAEVDRSHADVAQAEKNLADVNVMAPFDGVATRRSVEPGNYVQPGQQLLTLISSDRWVVANFKESQITRMHPGQKVNIHIDAYPDHVFQGTVDSLQAGTGARFSLFPPENATGNFVKIVQRVPVKIKFTGALDPKYDIGPGLSVVATVNTE